MRRTREKQTEKKKQGSPLLEESNREEKARSTASPGLFSCRYRQVAGNASAVLLSALAAPGLSVKEKQGGERGSEREREGGRARKGGP